MRMHAGQVNLTPAAVAALVAQQFPQWSRLPVHPVASTGTVNALFRLGDEYVLRLPLVPADTARAELEAEQAACRFVAPHVPLQVPEPVALGEQGDGFPGPWAVYRWIDGDVVAATELDDDTVLARDLAAFVRALHGIGTDGRSWDGRSRGGPLAVHDCVVRKAIAASTNLVDAAAIGAAWERCVQVPRTAPDVWLHADLMPGNLLLRDGRLAAVIDLGMLCVGDPAVDLMPAWNLLSAGGRELYRRTLGVDDRTWERGRGWAILQAIIALPYYVDTNPAMADTARRTLRAALS